MCFRVSQASVLFWYDWATSLSLFSFMHWRRKRQPTPVFLPGESQGWGAWWADVHGIAQSRTWLKWLSSSSSSSFFFCSSSSSFIPGFATIVYNQEYVDSKPTLTIFPLISMIIDVSFNQMVWVRLASRGVCHSLNYLLWDLELDIFLFPHS